VTESERQTETDKQLAIYGETMRKQHAVPVICIGVRTDGHAAVCLAEAVPPRKMIEYLKQLTAMLEAKL
jgi:hypothetical protein